MLGHQHSRFFRYAISVMLFLSLLTINNIAQAHFIWTFSDDGQIKVVFGEG